MTPRPDEPSRLVALIAALSRPQAYPHPVSGVEVRQTHISCVFLAGPFAYKLKKPIDFGFLDYSRLEDRVRFAEEEVRINRRLAPAVYLGLEWVREGPAGLGLGGEGPKVDVLVKMRRLPDEATFLARVRSARLAPLDLEQLAERLVPFYAAAERGPRAARYASVEVVRANALENFDQLSPFSGPSLPKDELAALRVATERRIDALSPLIEARAASHACETHGDLRLEHVYRLGDGVEGLVVIDGVEFSERLRFADPAADVAFLVMELEREGEALLAERFIARYVALSGDTELPRLLPLYVSYRALVRAKIELFKTEELELPSEDRAAAPRRARVLVDLARRLLLGAGAETDHRAGGLTDDLLRDAADDEVG